MGWKGVTVPKLVLYSPAAPETNVKVLKSVQPIRYALVLCFSYTPGPLHLPVPTAVCALHPENHLASPVPAFPSACCPKCLLFMEAWQILYTVAVLVSVYICHSKRKFHEEGSCFFVHYCHLSTYNSTWHSRMSSNTRCVNEWMGVETGLKHYLLFI